MRLWASFLFSVDVHACASRSDIQLSGGARYDADCLVRLEKPLRANGAFCYVSWRNPVKNRWIYTIQIASGAGSSIEGRLVACSASRAAPTPAEFREQALREAA